MSEQVQGSNRGGIRRRNFLAATAVGIPSLAVNWSQLALAAEGPGNTPIAAQPNSFPGLILREREPVNLEFPFPTLDAEITPNHRFFVRTHFKIPQLDSAAWRLRIDGHVEKELEFSYNELRKLPARNVTATLECAGNGRGFLVPKAKGLPWELGGISTAVWTGVPLAALLEKAGVRVGAVDVVLEGADQGEINDDPKSPGKIAFERSLPLAKARQPEVLLAYQMNGEPLPVKHGFPVRAIVPGWYGMASVKWLKRISVTSRPFQGYWQSVTYAYWQTEMGRPTLVPVTTMAVKSTIARPCLQEVVPAGKPYRVHGAAWAGEADIAKVEFSSNGGRTWQSAKLVGQQVPFAWRLWEFDWDVPRQPGTYPLQARATDTLGRTQPLAHDRNHGGYQIHHVITVEVEVR